MKVTHVLWDFNGTILDDVEPCIKSINELLVGHGLKPLESVAEYQSVFGFPIKDYYERIGFDFLTACARTERADFFAYRDGDEFVGFAFVLLPGPYAYLLYTATVSARRSRFLHSTATSA